MFAAKYKHYIIMDCIKKKIYLVIFLLLLLVPANLTAKENGHERLFQIGLFPPISSNGTNSIRTVNAISLNLIGGCSSGNEIFELGGVWNASRDYTNGLQIAGLLNYSGDSRNSVQISGAANIAVSGKSPLQIGGLFNVADEVNGLQFSALVNVAKKVRGVQIGLVNYMDDGRKGVSIGLINIARHGGKYEFEVSFSEAVNTLLSFRLGTDRFYTVFSGGINYFSSTLEYAIGLGFGTSIDWGKNWSNQIEIQAFGISSDKKFTENSVNSIIQLRLPVCVMIAKHFKIFAGPTLNLGLQDTTAERAAALSPWTMWNTSWNKLQAGGWIGLVAGFRF